MMTQSQAREDVIGILREVREDLNPSTMLTEDTRLFADLGFESIDLVALGAVLEQHFDQSFNYAEFLARARREQWADITVGQLLRFLASSLGGTATVHR